MPTFTFPATQYHQPLTSTKLYCLVTGVCEQLASLGMTAMDCDTLSQLCDNNNLNFLHRCSSRQQILLLVVFKCSLLKWISHWQNTKLNRNWCESTHTVVHTFKTAKSVFLV